jgi:hypothetical protein
MQQYREARVYGVAFQDWPVRRSWVEKEAESPGSKEGKLYQGVGTESSAVQGFPLGVATEMVGKLLAKRP